MFLDTLAAAYAENGKFADAVKAQEKALEDKSYVIRFGEDGQKRLRLYQAKKPFDESYSREPASFAIGVGQVVSGWDKTLVGATVGSRMILAIPPADGYGKQGNPDAGIKGTDTLYFVVDIVGAA